MKYKQLFVLVFFLTAISCQKEVDIDPQNALSEQDLETIAYFKEIALGFEFGNSSRVTRKWRNELNVYVIHEDENELIEELDEIISEINRLVSDGFTLSRTEKRNEASFVIFLGSAEDYVKLYPDQSNLVASNRGLFQVFWNSSGNFSSGYMYVDTEKVSIQAQKHLLREELTQSLGLARDSNRYLESIFQAQWTTTQDYLPIDKELIRLLYHPKIRTNLNATQVEDVLKEILLEEKNEAGNM